MLLYPEPGEDRPGASGGFGGLSHRQRQRELALALRHRVRLPVQVHGLHPGHISLGALRVEGQDQLGAGSGGDDISTLLASVLGGRSLDMENANEYLTAHRFPDEALVWQTGEGGVPVLRLNEQQWGLVQDLELRMHWV